MFQIPHDQRIGIGDVSYIEEIPLGIKVADANDRRRELSLDAGDLHGKCRNHEGLRLPRTGVIEWAQADALEPRSYQRTESKIGSRLGRRILVEWSEQRVFVQC